MEDWRIDLEAPMVRTAREAMAAIEQTLLGNGAKTEEEGWVLVLETQRTILMLLCMINSRV